LIDSIFFKSSHSNSFPVFIVCFLLISQVFILFIFNFSIMNIYVSNLSFNTSDVELQDLFSKFGEVSSAKVITDRETGRSRGFGFVEMPNDAEGKEAMSVSVAKEREARTGGGGGYSSNRGGGGGGYSNNRGGGGNSRW
jgi:uncharacterized membrane protein YgcG